MNAQQSEPSNLLIIISDEHRKDAMGCTGHPLVKTPNLDSLARRGTTFLNAYTPSPMCVPARASLACGDYVHNIRHWDSATPYDGKRRSWMAQLRDQGVPVTSIGKLHFRSGEDDNGFTQECLPMHVVGGVGWAVGLLRENTPDYDSASELARDVGIGSSSYTNYDLDITRTTEEWIKSDQRKDQSWAAFVSLVSPHYPLTCPEAFYNLYNPATIDLPVGYGTHEKPSHSELENIAVFFDYDRYFDEQKMREAKAAYYGLTSFMDDCVGRVLRALQDSGQADNTVVVYVSDHGDMMGDQGFWTKQVMYEQSAGIPMIAAGPGIPAGKRIQTGTSLIDLAPTAVDVTGITQESPNGLLPGISLREVANMPDNTDRTIFSEYHDGGSTTGTFMVRWNNWKYVHYVGHDSQLFNLQTDPDELHNLAAGNLNDPVVCNALAEGLKRLKAICDPAAVNKQCFTDQRKRIKELGGEEACLNAYVFNHTPAPREQSDLSDDSGAE